VQAPAAQTSPVQTSPSSAQASVLAAWTQPVAGLHESVVHEFPSSQFGAPPPTQVPPEHWSPVLQAVPSLHAAVLFGCVQVPAAQRSSVQAFPSSAHAAVWFAWTQPVAGLHVSMVHSLRSLQSGPAPPRQAPPRQKSPVVHPLPSSQDAVLFGCVQVPATHRSSVHAFPSSVQATERFEWTQPVAGTHVSAVHSLWSSHSAAAPPLQVPPEQASAVVQAFPSLHGTVLAGCVQAPAAQRSSVQTLPSSVHDSALFEWAQPEAGLQESVVHTFPSSQSGAAPPTHVPPEQVSAVVHALLSLHGAVLNGCVQTPAEHTSVVHTFPSVAHATVLLARTQPVDGLQESVVHTFPSSQFGAAPPTHVPPEQVSAVVHALLSLHEAVLFACVQEPDEQTSVVQTFPSSVHATVLWA
jgi:phage-related protein